MQNASTSNAVPDPARIQSWVEAALAVQDRAKVELTVRVVDEAEAAELNETYRHKQGPTNVLSFPFEDPPGVETGILGDLVVCAPVVEREAHEQGIALESHWAHMVVHGVLHLYGYDHLDDAGAREMEAIESRTLTGLGIDDPYME